MEWHERLRRPYAAAAACHVPCAREPGQRCRTGVRHDCVHNRGAQHTVCFCAPCNPCFASHAWAVCGRSHQRPASPTTCRCLPDLLLTVRNAHAVKLQQHVARFEHLAREQDSMRLSTGGARIATPIWWAHRRLPWLKGCHCSTRDMPCFCAVRWYPCRLFKPDQRVHRAVGSPPPPRSDLYKAMDQETRRGPIDVVEVPSPSTGADASQRLPLPRLRSSVWC